MNVVLIILESFCTEKIFGYEPVREEITPNINNLARNGSILLQYITPANSSSPSLSCIFTGCYQMTHGNHKNNSKLNNNILVLSEALKKEGYITFGAVSVGVLGSSYGFNRGFDLFSNSSKYDKFMYVMGKIGNEKFNLRKCLRTTGLFDIFYRPCYKTNEEIFNFLNKNKDKKFFLFVEYFDTHGDKKTSYYNNIKLMDGAVGKLVDELKKYNLFRDTLIIIAGDHGETLLDSGKRTHGFDIVESEFKVPCIFHMPQLVPKKMVNLLTRSIDIFPTIMDFIGNKNTFEIDGVSIKETIINDKKVVNEVFIESFPERADIKGLRTDKWCYKLREGEKEELYDIINDAKYKNDLSSEYEDICSEFKLKVKNHFKILI